MPSRRTTRSTKKREDAAAKENEAANNNSEQPPPAAPPKNPKARADGNGKKTAANASPPQALKLKSFGDLSDDEIIAGIEVEEGGVAVAFLEQHGVDVVKNWFWENLGVRVKAQKVNGTLVVKLRKGLRMVSYQLFLPTTIPHGCNPTNMKCNSSHPPL